ncbi:MAG: T9SS type A sorting domain-containing protein [Flavobacteriales bacterium]|nr:T9SS type A sorting domain-containing protein [Flavobacteriales bacterium]
MDNRNPSKRTSRIVRWWLTGLMAAGLGLVGTVQVKAQVSGYGFSQTIGTYTAITGGTVSHASGWDDTQVSGVAIGFTFVFNNVGYTTCNINPNGSITFGATTSPGYTPISGTSGYAGAIGGWGRDLQAQNSAPLGEIRYLSSGGVFTVQWSNARRYNASTTNAERFEMQIQLFQTTNEVKVIYGTWSDAVSATTTNLGEVGLRGATNADYNNRTVAAGGSWSASTTGTANNVTCYYNQATVATKPPVGLTYTWAPPVCSGTPATAAITGPGTICSGNAATLNVTPLPFANLTYDWFMSTTPGGPYTTPAGSGSSISTGVLTTGSYYYVCTTTCSNGGGNSTSAEYVLNVNALGSGATYTIDNTLPNGGGNFASFTNAINALNSTYLCGISGPVVVNVTAGQSFNENPPALTASGGSAINSITFQKSGAGTNPLITPTGTAGTTDFGLCVTGGDFITFDGIDINASAVSAVEFGYLVRNASTTNGANDVTIKNCAVSLNRNNTGSMGVVNSMATTVGAGFTPASALGTNNNFLVDNVTVTNCFAQGIRVEGNATFRPSGHIIQNSTVGAAYAGQPLPDIGNASIASSPTGIYVANVDGVKVRNNTVRNVGVTQPTTANAAKGIWLNLCYGTTNEVNNNRVYGIRNFHPTVLSVARGIEILAPTTTTVITNVWNNTVTDITSNYSGALTASRGISGIFCSVGSATATYNVDHNSVSVNGNGSLNTSSACFEFGGSTAIYNLRNNAFANYTGAQTAPALHVAVYSASGTTTIANTASVMNYNDLYVPNLTQGGVAFAVAALRTTNAAYDLAVTVSPTSNDANSISADPLFTADMHTQGTALNGASLITVAGLTTDMDGATRTAPQDIGADDFTPPACVAPTASYYIYSACATSQFFAVVTVSSLGTAANVNLSSDAAGNPGGLLAQGLGTYTVGPFPSGTPVNITVEHTGNATCNLVLSGLNYDCATNGGKNALSFVYNGITPANSTRVLCGTAAGTLNITGTAITVEAWIYPTAFRSNVFEGSILNKEGSPGGYMLRCGGQGVLEFAFASGPAAAASPTGTLTLNTWQHVAGTFDGTTVRLYKNGIQVASTASTVAIPSSASVQFAIGGSVTFPDRAFSGLIDEVRIWNTVIPPLQILGGMNQLYCGSEPGLQGYYRFDQGQSNAPNPGINTLTDLTANANTGTLTNFALTGTTSNWVQGVTTMTPCVNCFAPTALGIANLTPSSVDLTWTNNASASYDWELRTSGLPGSGAVGLVQSGNSLVSPASVVGLPGSTTMTLYVRGVCVSPTATSFWTSGPTFITPCVATTIPYVENFDGVTTPALPVCMILQNVNGGTTWTSVNAPTGYTGKTAQYTFSGSLVGDDWIYTQGLTMAAGTVYKLTFKYGNNSTTFTEKLEVKYGTAPTAGSMSNALLNFPSINQNAPQNASTYFVAPSAGVYYVGFHAYSAINQFNLFLDDISVTLAPACIEPTAVNISSLQATQATVNWNCPLCTGNFYVEYGAPGFTPGIDANPGTGTMAGPFAGTSGVLNSLIAQTNYQVVVRQDCSGSFSTNSIPVNFTTPCSSANVPYFENFDAVTTPAIPACMSVENVNGGTTWTTVTAPTGYTGKTAQYSFSGSLVGDDWIYTQGLNLTAGTIYNLTFKYGNNSTTFIEKLEVKYGNSPGAAAMANTIVQYPTINQNAPQSASVYFVPATSGVQFIGFHAYSAVNQFNLFLDDISVVAVPCVTPTATYTVVPNCVGMTGDYTVQVNLTDLGLSPTVDIVSNYPGNPGADLGVPTTGVYSVGPFPSGSTVDVTVVNNSNNACNLVLSSLTYDCANPPRALSFDGVNDRLNCGNGASINITGTALTVEAWINPSSWRTFVYEGNIVNKEGAGFQGYMLRAGANGTLNFEMGMGGNWQGATTGTGVLTLNQWQHVAGTYDGARIRLYKNGVEVLNVAATGSIALAPPPLHIGSAFDYNTRNFPGIIEEVRIWNTTLSSTQLLDNLNRVYCGTEPGLMAYYRFDQGVPNGSNPTITTLADQTAFGNNGALAGFALTGATSNWVTGRSMAACVPITCPQPLNLNIANVQQTTANLVWTNNGSPSYQYEVRTSGGPGSGPAGLIASGTSASSPAAVSGLSASTTYSFYVRSVCAGPTTSYWSANSFFTPACTSVNVPYTINPSAGIVACTSVQNLNQGVTWAATGAPTGFTTQVMSYSHSNNVAANDWYFSQGLNLSAGTNYRLTFKTGNNNLAYAEGMRVLLGGSALAADMTTLLWQNAAISTGPGVAQTVVVDFTVPSSAVYNLGFHCNSIPLVNATGPILYLDEINVDVAPACLPPANVTATNILTNTADVTWSCLGCTGQFYVEYGPTGFTPGTGIGPNGGTVEGPFFTNSGSLVGPLTDNTLYQVYVRQDCSGSFSANSLVASFTTACLPTTIPYSENFNGVTTPANPACMRTQDVNGAGTWATQAQPAGWSTGQVARVNSLIYIPANDWYFLPPMTLTGGVSHRITFTYGNATASKVNKLELKYGASANSGAMSTAIVSLPTITNTAPATFSMDFVPAASGDQVIGFHTYSAADQGTFYLDNIQVDLSPSCIDPTNVTASNIGLNSLDLSWNCPTCTGSFYVEYGLPAFTPGTDATAGPGGTVIGPIAGTTVTIPGLNPLTTYKFHVRQECTPSVFGANSQAVQFSTTCPPAYSAPFIETFSSASLPGCWSTYNFSATPTQVWNFSNNTVNSNPSFDPDFGVENVLDHTSGYQGFFAWYNGDFGTGFVDVALESPSINTSTLTAPQVRFWFYSDNTTDATRNALRLDGWNGSVWQTLTSVDNSVNQAGWREVVANVPGAFPSITKFRVVANAAAGNSLYNDLLVDDFMVVSTPACDAPVPTVSDVTTYNATVNWTCAGCTGTYIVEYGPAGFVPGFGVTAGGGTVVTSATSPIALTGLTANTVYTVFVRQDCLGNGTSIGLNGGPSTFTTAPGCGDNYYDDGGLAGNYTVSQNTIKTICPSTPGDLVNVVFSAFNTVAGSDPLYVYDGTSTAAPLIASANGVAGAFPAGGWSGNGLAFAPSNIGIQGSVLATNPSGCLTFQHRSDAGSTAAGWAATVSCITGNFTCATAKPLGCFGVENGIITGASSLPPSACAFNGATTTGGTAWYLYTAGADEDVTFSVCNPSIDVRINAFKATAAPDCSNLVCIGGADDSPGCAPGADLKVKANTGDLIYIAVSGVTGASGSFTITTTCDVQCSPTVANDMCAGATDLNPLPYVGFGTPITDDNTCAYVDGPTGNSGAEPVQGLWYTFNSGVNSKLRMTLTAGTASNLKWALHSGLCDGLDAFSEVANGNASGVTILNVTPATDYRLVVFNTGGPGVQGTFTLNVEKPGVNDASISEVLSPSGLLCDTQFQPVVKLKNLGEATLTNVQITVKEDAVTEYVYNWTGPALAFGDSVQLTLPLVTSTGVHVLNVNTDLPNGVADDLPSNDLASSAYQANGQTVKVRVTTDNNPGQTTWIIYEPGNIPVASGGPYVIANNQTTTTICLPVTGGNTKWFFFLFDSFGDGICCSQGTGSWQVLDKLDRVIMRDNGQFTTQSPATPPLTATYSAGHEINLPIGPARPWTASPYNVCGVFNLGVQAKIRSTTVAGATSYQWEFSNPDAGYQRRVSASVNYVTYVSMQAMPPSLGVTYFVRNRADQGTAGFNDDRWGEGCELGWNNSNSQFCTGLVSTAGSTFSCGATRTFGGSSKIWATPVVGAFPYDANGNGSYADAGDQQFAYHFRFTGPGAYVRDIYTATYICPLAWTTNPLLAGNTYQVQVETQVAGVWRGFCGTTCNLTIAAGPGQGAGRMDAAVTEENIQLWPNPVRDGIVNLRIDGIVDADQRISVDIYDAFGKKVVAQQYANSGSLFNTVLNLDGGMAAGLYMVNITINDRTSLKRLTVL